MRGTILPVFVWKLNKTPAEDMQDYWGGLIQPLIQPLGADPLLCQWLIEPGFSSWKPAAPNPCSRCAKEGVGWSFDWCVFSVVRMLARYPFSCLPLTPPFSPIMGAREYGFDKDRDLSRVQPSQNSTAASGLNGLSGLKLGFIEPSPSMVFSFSMLMVVVRKFFARGYSGLSINCR